MNRINKHITVVDNFVDTKCCKQLFQYLINNTNQPYHNDNNMPWFIGNNIFYQNITDAKIKTTVKNINYAVSNLISYLHNIEIYPHFCDLVLWREGQHMMRHVDDGSNLLNDEGNCLKMRKYSAIIYLNEGYIGGETFLRLTKTKDYISTPKTGSLISFRSDDKSAHGVKIIEKGIRGTIAMWFCTDKKYCQM